MSGDSNIIIVIAVPVTAKDIVIATFDTGITMHQIQLIFFKSPPSPRDLSENHIHKCSGFNGTVKFLAKVIFMKFESETLFPIS